VIPRRSGGVVSGDFSFNGLRCGQISVIHLTLQWVTLPARIRPGRVRKTVGPCLTEKELCVWYFQRMRGSSELTEGDCVTCPFDINVLAA